jgi:plasmid stability protein
MSSLLIRDLDDDVKTRLRIRAAENGHSMEAEARAILAKALVDQRKTPPRYGIGTYLHERAMEVGGFELDIPPRTELAGRVDFSGPEYGTYDDE